MVVANNATDFRRWVKESGTPWNRAIYANVPHKLYGLDETLVSNVVELTGDHPMLYNDQYLDLRERVERWRNKKPWDDDPIT